MKKKKKSEELDAEQQKLIAKAKVDEGGRIPIPAQIRKAMALKTGDTMTLVLEEDTLMVMNSEQTLKSIQKKLGWPLPYSIVDELLQERREEAARE